MAKLSRKTIIAGSVSIILIAACYFLVFTGRGLDLQMWLAIKLDSDGYRRFLAYRAATFRIEDDQVKADQRVLAAKILTKVVEHDLVAASQMLDAVINKRPATVYYAQRGTINMRLTRYREAQSDFEAAVRNWRGSGFTTDAFEAYSNCLLEATACLEAQQKAWTNRTYELARPIPDNSRELKQLAK